MDFKWNFPEMMRRLVLLIGVLLAQGAAAAETGSSVIVIYNSAVPESKDVAEYYARKRDVPPKQVLGFALPETESMTRDEYLEKLERPLWNLLETRGLFKIAPSGSISNLVPGTTSGKQVVASSIRYAALCYKVPTKIAH